MDKEQVAENLDILGWGGLAEEMFVAKTYNLPQLVVIIYSRSFLLSLLCFLKLYSSSCISYTTPLAKDLGSRTLCEPINRVQ